MWVKKYRIVHDSWLKKKGEYLKEISTLLFHSYNYRMSGMPLIDMH